MRSRRGLKQAPCEYCGKQDVWELEVTSSKGRHLRWEPVCVLHGERPDLRARAAAGKAAA